MKKAAVALFAVSLFLFVLTIASSAQQAIFNGPEPEATAINASTL